MRWTAAEIEYLRKYRDVKTVKQLAKALKRPENAIGHAARRYGIGTIIENSDLLTTAEIVRLTGLTNGTIGTKWRQEGLRTRKIGPYRYVTQDHLAEFMRTHPNRWDWKRCDESYFGRYKWFQEIKATDGNGFSRRSYLSDRELSAARFLMETGKTTKEVAEKLGRSVYTIRGLKARDRAIRGVINDFGKA